MGKVRRSGEKAEELKFASEHRANPANKLTELLSLVHSHVPLVACLSVSVAET